MYERAPTHREEANRTYTSIKKRAINGQKNGVRDKQTSESGANKEVDSNLKLDN